MASETRITVKHDPIGRAFGLAIAFLAPGMIGLYAASLHVAVLRSWFEAAGRGQTTIGGFLSMVIAASGAGVFLSGMRWCLVEERIKQSADVPAEHETAGRRDAETELAYQNIREQHYDFYLFYSNTLVALAVLWLTWLPSQLVALPADVSWTTVKPILITALGGATGWVLFASATDAYTRYQKKRAELLKNDRTESPTGTLPRS